MEEDNNPRPEELKKDTITPPPREETPGGRCFSPEELIKKKNKALIILFSGLGCLVLIVIAFTIVFIMIYVISQNLQV